MTAVIVTPSALMRRIAELEARADRQDAHMERLEILLIELRTLYEHDAL